MLCFSCTWLGLRAQHIDFKSHLAGGAVAWKDDVAHPLRVGSRWFFATTAIGHIFIVIPREYPEDIRYPYIYIFIMHILIYIYLYHKILRAQTCYCTTLFDLLTMQQFCLSAGFRDDNA